MCINLYREHYISTVVDLFVYVFITHLYREHYISTVVDQEKLAGTYVELYREHYISTVVDRCRCWN